MSDRSAGGRRGAAGRVGLRGRIAALPDFLGGTPELSEADARRVLEERARVLATPSEERRSDDHLELVLLELAGESYGIESRFVYEMMRSAELVALPRAEPRVAGITAWRGGLLTVLDLRPVMGLPGSTGEHPRPILVLGDAQPVFGVVVDDVLGIQEITLAEMHAPDARAGDRADFIQATTADAVLVIAGADLIQTHS